MCGSLFVDLKQTMLSKCRSYTLEFGQFMASVLRAVTEKSFSCEPREPCTVDFTKTDWELFRAHCVDQDYNLLGDLWHDDAWWFLFFCALSVFSFLFLVASFPCLLGSSIYQCAGWDAKGLGKAHVLFYTYAASPGALVQFDTCQNWWLGEMWVGSMVCSGWWVA